MILNCDVRDLKMFCILPFHLTGIPSVPLCSAKGKGPPPLHPGVRKVT